MGASLHRHDPPEERFLSLNQPSPPLARVPVLPLLLVAAGILLPPAALAAGLRGGDPMPVGLVTGVWLLKLLLVGHGVAALMLRRWLPARPAAARAPLPMVGLVALVVVGLALRIPGVSDGLWYDEIQTLVDYVRQPWGVLLTSFDSSNQHFLYSITARFTTGLLGESALALRLPAVAFGVASLVAAVWFARRWMPAREAWWSAIILAVSYHHVWFSQNARGYTGLLLGTLIGTGLFLDLLRGAAISRRLVWGYAIVMALTVTTHVTALAVVAGHGLAWLSAVGRLPSGRRRWAPAVALGLSGTVALSCHALVLPQMVMALGRSGTSAVAIEWQRPAWFLGEAITGLVRGVPAGVVVVPVAGIVVLVGIVATFRRDRDAMCLMLFPLLVMAALLFATGHNLWPRFFFFGAGFVVQWAVRGGHVMLERLVPRHAARVADAGLAAVVIGSVALLPRAWAPKQDYRAAAAWLAEHATPDDAIVATEMLDLPMNRWLQHDWPVALSAETLAALEAPRATTWLIYTFPIRLAATAPDLWQRLQAGYRVAHVVPASVGGGEVVITRRSGPG